MSLADELRKALGDTAVLEGESMGARPASDMSLTGNSLPRALIRPRSTEELATALKLCNEARVPVIAQGGMTGLAGGANPSGHEIAIMAEDGSMLPVGELGEVVIRGRNVTLGYENNPEANAKAFTHGWFRTGDEGYLDAEGYLRLTGRLKEIINRGGEKVSPLEVDNLLMEHPDVAQCLTFAMPHAKLGEEVAAVVVLREGAEPNEHAIRDFAAERLAAFKVPRKIVFLDEIPKGATGKLMRIGLAAKLGLSA